MFKKKWSLPLGSLGLVGSLGLSISCVPVKPTAIRRSTISSVTRSNVAGDDYPSGGGTPSKVANAAADMPVSTAATDQPTGAKPDGFGPNVMVFDPTMNMGEIQTKLDQIFQKQEQNQFGAERYAYFFKPGQYSVDVKVGFYTQVLGLGASPDNTLITGAIRVTADWFKGNGTQNFWRGAENIAVIPTLDNKINVWAVSQATALRRFHVKGSTNLWDAKYDPAWTSGGFMADSMIDDQINSGSQQQFLLRNSSLHQWIGGVWNMVFVGDNNAPAPSWPTPPHTVIPNTPEIREKPYVIIDGSGKYAVAVPSTKANSVGISWGADAAPTTTLPIEKFYIAHASYDTAGTMNDALASGKNLLLTPGVYHIKNSLRITAPGTIVMGLGIASIIPDNGTEAIFVDDVDDVTVTGLLFDAGPKESETLIRMGSSKTGKSHAGHPLILSDLSCRVGGVNPGLAKSCVIIETANTTIDNVWLWRADHGNGVGWDVNKATNGIIIDGDSVTAYGLFVEHFEEYQTIWNGENGLVYFYQSEIPYDVPTQDRWTHNGVKGWSSFKVGEKVTKFTANGLGIYAFFNNPVVLENAIEAPTVAGVQIHHIVTQWLGTANGSGINHIINGTGKSVQYITPGIDSAYSAD